MSNQSRRVFLRRTAAAGAGAALGVAGTNSYRRLRAADSPASAYWTPAEPPNRPVGEPQGIFPGRVAWIHDPDVAVWGGDTSSGGWYENKFTDPVGAARMLSQSLRRLSGAETDAEAWDAVFRHHNRMRGRGDVGYQAGEVVAVKLNMNCAKRQAEPS